MTRILKQIGYCFRLLFVVTFVVGCSTGDLVRLPVTSVGKSGSPSPISDAMVRGKGRGKATGIPRAKEIALNLGSNAEKLNVLTTCILVAHLEGVCNNESVLGVSP